MTKRFFSRLSLILAALVMLVISTYADTALVSLSGYTFTSIESGDPTVQTVVFGTDTYVELISGVFNRTGTYTYNKLSATTGLAVEVIDGANRNTVTLLFTTVTNGTYTNARVRNGSPAGTRTGAFTVTITLGLPQLTIIPSGGSVIVTWPTNATGFTLQSTTNLSSTVGWSNVSASSAVVNGQFVVNFPLSDTQAYYRLRK